MKRPRCTFEPYSHSLVRRAAKALKHFEAREPPCLEDFVLPDTHQTLKTAFAAEADAARRILARSGREMMYLDVSVDDEHEGAPDSSLFLFELPDDPAFWIHLVVDRTRKAVTGAYGRTGSKPLSHLSVAGDPLSSSFHIHDPNDSSFVFNAPSLRECYRIAHTDPLQPVPDFWVD